MNWAELDGTGLDWTGRRAAVSFPTQERRRRQGHKENRKVTAVISKKDETIKITTVTYLLHPLFPFPLLPQHTDTRKANPVLSVGKDGKRERVWNIPWQA